MLDCVFAHVKYMHGVNAYESVRVGMCMHGHTHSHTRGLSTREDKQQPEHNLIFKLVLPRTCNLLATIHSVPLN